MKYTQGKNISLTTIWTEVNPNFIISYASIYVISGNIESEIYDDTGWFKLETGKPEELIKYIESAKKVRFRASTGIAEVNYYLKGNPFLITTHEEKTAPVDADEVLVNDSEDNNTVKRLKYRNLDTSEVTTGLFEITADGDFTPTDPIPAEFEQDYNSDLMPEEGYGSVKDENYEIDTNGDIMPRI